MFLTVKEAWLINSLVDYYYIAQTDRVIDILTSVREPHDKVSKINQGVPSFLSCSKENQKHMKSILSFYLVIVTM